MRTNGERRKKFVEFCSISILSINEIDNASSKSKLFDVRFVNGEIVVVRALNSGARYFQAGAMNRFINYTNNNI